jgi:hypothetical protein
MKKVRITWPKNDYISRQTFGDSLIWGNFEFTFEEIPSADYWIIVNNYQLGNLSCFCPPTNILYILQEPSSVSEYNNDNHTEEFIKQFGSIITIQDSIKGSNVRYQQVGIPWFINKSIDDLIIEPICKKTKNISIVTSNKTYTKGHRDRIDCAMRIKRYFGSYVDLFGRGFNDFDDKWDVVSPYRYHISIENFVERNYFSEKIIDPILAYSLPIYYGCPNISDFFDLSEDLKILDLKSFDTIKKKIKFIIENDHFYENNLQFLTDSRIKILENYNFFPMVCSIMDKLESSLPCNNEILYSKLKSSKLLTLKKIFQKKYFLSKTNILNNCFSNKN